MHISAAQCASVISPHSSSSSESTPRSVLALGSSPTQPADVSPSPPPYLSIRSLQATFHRDRTILTARVSVRALLTCSRFTQGGPGPPRIPRGLFSPHTAIRPRRAQANRALLSLHSRVAEEDGGSKRRMPMDNLGPTYFCIITKAVEDSRHDGRGGYGRHPTVSRYLRALIMVGNRYRELWRHHRGYPRRSPRALSLLCRDLEGSIWLPRRSPRPRPPFVPAFVKHGYTDDMPDCVQGLGQEKNGLANAGSRLY
ncbi:hypothetical protein B0H16DRAFT_235396 [Mycena metata]|uniref:Uncharacterized protein n=1 Tax=Mycena metata TaxID=1033252 RepID=A0AAD7JRA5_9AGAR|nr:hypothetical protein B0H16DRAFT_235396 [Mycena metata]